MIDLPEISDEAVDAFARAFNACSHEGQHPLCCTRAGLAAALVASGYRREADVLREAADTIEARYPAEIWHPASTSPDAMAAKGVRVACNQLRHMATERATALEPSPPLPVADGSEPARRCPDGHGPNTVCGYCAPVSSTGEEKTT